MKLSSAFSCFPLSLLLVACIRSTVLSRYSCCGFFCHSRRAVLSYYASQRLCGGVPSAANIVVCVCYVHPPLWYVLLLHLQRRLHLLQFREANRWTIVHLDQSQPPSYALLFRHAPPPHLLLPTATCPFWASLASAKPSRELILKAGAPLLLLLCTINPSDGRFVDEAWCVLLFRPMPPAREARAASGPLVGKEAAVPRVMLGSMMRLPPPPPICCQPERGSSPVEPTFTMATKQGARTDACACGASSRLARPFPTADATLPSRGRLLMATHTWSCRLRGCLVRPRDRTAATRTTKKLRVVYQEVSDWLRTTMHEKATGRSTHGTEGGVRGEGIKMRGGKSSRGMKTLLILYYRQGDEAFPTTSKVSYRGGFLNTRFHSMHGVLLFIWMFSSRGCFCCLPRRLY